MDVMTDKNKNTQKYMSSTFLNLGTETGLGLIT